MAISLNNHETRIKALENGGSSTWTKGSNSNGTWIQEASTQTMIQFNTLGVLAGDYKVIYFAKAFKSPPTVVFTGQGRRFDGSGWVAVHVVYDVTTTQFRLGHVNPVNFDKIAWIAIGYLISDRILNYTYACKSLLFTPLKTIGGVK